jgi:aryl-alcohol dehydrogenase-like predicted oxidoreductase
MGEIIKRAIPSSGELLPVVGLGTWQIFDRQQHSGAALLEKLYAGGGTMIDTSPMYLLPPDFNRG